MPFWFVRELGNDLLEAVFSSMAFCQGHCQGPFHTNRRCSILVTYTKVKGRSPPVRWKEYVFGLAFLVTLLFVAAFCL